MTNDGNFLVREMDVCTRPEERLNRIGPEVCTEAELLTVLLRLNSIVKAEELLARHTLAGLMSMPVPRLFGLKHLNPRRASILAACAELARRIGSKTEAGLPTILSVNDISAQVVDIREKKKEYLMAFFLNARHQLIAKDIISIGTLTASLAHPREIFAPAIGKAAAGVILAHNHPSGDVSPSDEDVRLTKRIAQAGTIMGIELLDHLIVGVNGSYSFKTSGAL